MTTIGERGLVTSVGIRPDLYTANSEGEIRLPGPLGLDIAETVLFERKQWRGQDRTAHITFGVELADGGLGYMVFGDEHASFGSIRERENRATNNWKKLQRSMSRPDGPSHQVSANRGQFNAEVVGLLKSLGWDGQIRALQGRETLPTDETPVGIKARRETMLDSTCPGRAKHEDFSDKGNRRALYGTVGALITTAAVTGASVAAIDYIDQHTAPLDAKALSKMIKRGLFARNDVNYRVVSIDVVSSGAVSNKNGRGQNIVDEVVGNVVEDRYSVDKQLASLDVVADVNPGNGPGEKVTVQISSDDNYLGTAYRFRTNGPNIFLSNGDNTYWRYQPGRIIDVPTDQYGKSPVIVPDGCMGGGQVCESKPRNVTNPSAPNYMQVRVLKPVPVMTYLASVNSQGDLVHKIKPGQNLFRIGLAFGIDWREIARANGIDPDNPIIYAERELIIPRQEDVRGSLDGGVGAETGLPVLASETENSSNLMGSIPFVKKGDQQQIIIKDGDLGVVRSNIQGEEELLIVPKGELVLLVGTETGVEIKTKTPSGEWHGVATVPTEAFTKDGESAVGGLTPEEFNKIQQEGDGNLSDANQDQQKNEIGASSSGGESHVVEVKSEDGTTSITIDLAVAEMSDAIDDDGVSPTVSVRFKTADDNGVVWSDEIYEVPRADYERAKSNKGIVAETMLGTGGGNGSEAFSETGESGLEPAVNSSLNGKTFLIYEFQAGETLYNVARRYGSTVDELNKANPDLELRTNRGMAWGSVYIPLDSSLDDYEEEPALGSIAVRAKSGNLQVEVPSGGFTTNQQKEIVRTANEIIDYFEDVLGPPANDVELRVFPQRVDEQVNSNDNQGLELFRDGTYLTYTNNTGAIYLYPTLFDEEDNIQDRRLFVTNLAAEVSHWWGFPSFPGFNDKTGLNPISSGSLYINYQDTNQFHFDYTIRHAVADAIVGPNADLDTTYWVDPAGLQIIRRYPDFYKTMRQYADAERSQEEWLDLAEQHYPGFIGWWNDL